jgi:hypothetical protein
VAQAEAGIESTAARLQRKAANHLVRSLTVPNTNPLFGCLTRLHTQGKNFPSPLTVTAKRFGPSIGFTADSLVETVEPVLQEPWTEGILGYSTEGLDDEEEEVTRRLRSNGPWEEERTLYTDATYKNGKGGIAVVQGKSWKTITQRRLPGWSVGDSTVAELIAIEAALSYQAPEEATPKSDNHSN